MVLKTRSSTEDNLLVRLRGIENSTLHLDGEEYNMRMSHATASSVDGSSAHSTLSQAHSTVSQKVFVSKHTSPVIENFTASSVGISTRSLANARWSFDAKIAGYIEHLVVTDTVNIVPRDTLRAPGSVTLDASHHFKADPDVRAKHLRSMIQPVEESIYGPFAGGKEAVFRGSMFLNNIQDVLVIGDEIYSSILVRMHDLDECDIHAVDVFYTFVDSFILRYYKATRSEVDECRDALLTWMEHFYDIRQRLRGTNGRDRFLIETLLRAMKRARHVIIRIARYEAKAGIVSMASNDTIWEDCLAGKIAYYMLTNGFSPHEQERHFKFSDILNLKKRNRTNKRQLKRVNELQKLAAGFTKAKEEYIKMFGPQA